MSEFPETAIHFPELNIEFTVGDLELLEDLIEKLYSLEMQRKAMDPERSKVIWNMKELCRRTGMDVLTVKQQFFTDERFQKARVGRTWLFPAKETEDFLLLWQREKDIKERGHDH